MFACKECHQLLEVRDGHNCPTGERQPEISREWQGFIEVLDPEKSALAKEMGIHTPGRYALRVR
jgi:RNA polymerase subunit RPABC4/transcription elongation factor Spt4